MVRRVLALPFVALAAACTFGLGEYATGTTAGAGTSTEADPTEDDGGTPGGENGGGDGSTPKKDAATNGDGSGPCTNNATRACTEPDGDAGTCNGTQRCVQGVWGACEVTRKCPTTWNVKTSTECKNVDVKGNSPDKWTESPMVSSDVVLWSLSRTTPFDLYGLTDSFCFVPKDTGNCLTTSTTAVHVKCTNANLKLSGNDFVNGSIHGTEFCVTNAGASCNVIDEHDAQWTATGGTVTCERWFEDAHWRVVAAPRCSW
jgi:hypothetical protein